ncbi:protein phosphatase inhibitor 2 [Lingula anatina]|uniref:Protein phosphatase inhibitor 2 n=1 Tax=Lingula anatina TaxID=7574 RepID=A0A1S3JGK7_LINAN|nr:protein phosphatase inhibitor 2 [Lingula anatina]|eukprot:XP_013409532.1 protein phosphatase inhibitor 2 [Lingula anatina]
MATSEHKPIRGILKNSTSFDKTEHSGKKEMTWDEMNIVATHHPADKDYGHMKITDPPTPYSKYEEPEDDELLEHQDSVDPISEDETDALDANKLAKRLEHNSKPKFMKKAAEEDDDEDDLDDLSESGKEKRKQFEQKRKLHYNEFYAVKLAKQLMEEEDEEEEDDEEEEKKNGQ